MIVLSESHAQYIYYFTTQNRQTYCFTIHVLIEDCSRYCINYDVGQKCTLLAQCRFWKRKG